MKKTMIRAGIFYSVRKANAAGFVIFFLLCTSLSVYAAKSSGETAVYAAESSAETALHTAENVGETDVHAAENGIQADEAADGKTADGPTVFTDSQGIVYELFDDGTCYISGCAQKADSLIIPQQIHSAGKSFAVKGIREAAFSSCGRLKKIEIPDSISGISGKTFSGCENLTDITVIPADIRIKKSGETITAAVSVNGAFTEAAEHVSLRFGRSILKKAVSNKACDTVTIMAAVTAAGGDLNTSLPGMILDENAVKLLSDSGKNLKITLKDAKSRKYHIKSGAANLKDVSGKLEFEIRQSRISKSSGKLVFTDFANSEAAVLESFRSDLKKAVRKNSLHADSLEVLTVSFGSGVKTDAELVFPAEAGKAGSEAYVYRYDKTNRVFVPVFYHPLLISKDGNIKISVSKGGIFAVSKKPFQAVSRKLSNEFLKESGHTYYIDKNGKAVCGWKKIGREYYYFDRKTGRMACSDSQDGIRLTDSGAAKKTNAAVKKIETMIKARAIVEQVTDASDSRSRKIEKCFLWIFQFPYKRYRRLQPIYRQPGWEVTFANDIFDHQKGCCVSEASALAFLFHECGYPEVYVACDTSHAWVELNGRVYDPLFAEARGFREYYNRSYDGYGMRPVVKRKI